MLDSKKKTNDEMPQEQATAAAEAPVQPKRGRGRPRKNPLPVEAPAAPVASEKVETPIAPAPAVAPVAAAEKPVKETPVEAPKAESAVAKPETAPVASAPAVANTSIAEPFIVEPDPPQSSNADMGAGVKTVQSYSLNSKYHHDSPEQQPVAQPTNVETPANAQAQVENAPENGNALPSENGGNGNVPQQAPAANVVSTPHFSEQELELLKRMGGDAGMDHARLQQLAQRILQQNGIRNNNNLNNNRRQQNQQNNNGRQQQRFQQNNNQRGGRNQMQNNRGNNGKQGRNNNMGGFQRQQYIQQMPPLPPQQGAAMPQDGTEVPFVEPVPEMNIADLQKKSFEELTEIANKLGIEGLGSLDKQNLVSEILRANAATQGVMYGGGYLEILPDGYGFLRSAQYNYLPSTQDIYLSPQQIRSLSVKNGDFIMGQTRPPREKERFYAMYKVDSINNEPIEKKRQIIPFYEMIPDFPDKRLMMETTPDEISMRVLDLVAPIGKGQRGLIVAPPRTGKTVLMQKIAKSILTNNPEVQLIILLIDERPEEVTDMKRVVLETKLNRNNVEIVSSTFDEEPQRHIQVAEMVIEKAKRMAEYQKDVVILLDSITRLARAYNTVAPHSGKILTGGVDANALHKPKNFFGAARNLKDHPGSITILATALVDTGSKMDDVIFEEFKGTGNMEIHLCRELVNKRVYPAIDIEASGTRREDLLTHPEELRRLWTLRKALNNRDVVEGMEVLISKLKQIPSNAEFLWSLNSKD